MCNSFHPAKDSRHLKRCRRTLLEVLQLTCSLSLPLVPVFMARGAFEKVLVNFINCRRRRAASVSRHERRLIVEVLLTRAGHTQGIWLKLLLPYHAYSYSNRICSTIRNGNAPPVLLLSKIDRATSRE